MITLSPRRAIYLSMTAIIAMLGISCLATSEVRVASAPGSPPAILPLQILTQRMDDAAPNAAQLRRGRYLVIAGDCMSCHVREGGEPLSGGLGINTPFGVIYSPNLTSDRETGVGAWNSDQFYRAMHDGIGIKGKNIYPAFPYPWFRLISREDSDAIFAFLLTTPPVH